MANKEPQIINNWQELSEYYFDEVLSDPRALASAIENQLLAYYQCDVNENGLKIYSFATVMDLDGNSVEQECSSELEFPFDANGVNLFAIECGIEDSILNAY